MPTPTGPLVMRKRGCRAVDGLDVTLDPIWAGVVHSSFVVAWRSSCRCRLSPGSAQLLIFCSCVMAAICFWRLAIGTCPSMGAKRCPVVSGHSRFSLIADVVISPHLRRRPELASAHGRGYVNDAKDERYLHTGGVL
jgi:hypothetical protein